MAFLIITIIIILLVIHIHYQSHILHNLICGFWEADSSFCEESGLDMFCMYLSDDYNLLGTRACYILASREGAIVLNEPTIADIYFDWTNFSNWYLPMTNAKYFDIYFKHISKEAVDIFPKKQKLRFYPVCNKIVLYYNKTITAVLYKNPVNTELSTVIKEASTP